MKFGSCAVGLLLAATLLVSLPRLSPQRSAVRPSFSLFDAEERRELESEQSQLRLDVAALERQLSHDTSAPALRSCPSDCNRRGTCNPHLGRCHCLADRRGDACEVAAEMTCNPAGGKGISGAVLTRCLPRGHCDTAFLKCLCGPTARYPDRPAHRCVYGDELTNPAKRVAAEAALYGSSSSSDSSWCNMSPLDLPRFAPLKADKCGPPRCPDGTSGGLCHIRTRAFCLNQCSGRGACRSGHCECEAGRAGVDCSIELRAVAPPPSARLGARLSAGSFAERYWRRALLRGPLGGDGAASVEYPRVYVYELPAEFNVRHVQQRTYTGEHGIGRFYDESNRTVFSSGAHSVETALHEALLASPHRTLDGESADYFYVPVYAAMYASSFMRPRYGHTLWNLTGDAKGSASLATSELLGRAAAHIASAYPWWNRSAGADHLWFHAGDEGACFAPSALNESIHLSHYGRTDRRPNSSAVNWMMTWSKATHASRPVPTAPTVLGWEACHRVGHDVVLPSWTTPQHIGGAPHARPRSAPRSKLLFFRGPLAGAGVGGGSPAFAFGLRQQLAAIARSEPDMLVSGSRVPSSLDVFGRSYEAHDRTEYLEQVSDATFCAVLPGAGFSTRFEEAVLRGCIPVLLADQLRAPFDDILDVEQFSLRVARADLPRIGAILRAVPAARVEAMRDALSHVWPRYSYISSWLAEAGDPRGEPHPRDRDALAGATVPQGCRRRDGRLGLGGCPDAIDTLLRRLALHPRRRRAR